jgi:hypothetical protein
LSPKGSNLFQVRRPIFDLPVKYRSQDRMLPHIGIKVLQQILNAGLAAQAPVKAGWLLGRIHCSVAELFTLKTISFIYYHQLQPMGEQYNRG